MNNEIIRNHYDAFSRIDGFRVKYEALFLEFEIKPTFLADLKATSRRWKRRMIRRTQGFPSRWAGRRN